MDYSRQYNLGFVAFNNLIDVESMIASIRKWHPKGLNRCLLVNHSTDAFEKSGIEEAAVSAGWSYVAKENGGFGAGVNQLVSMSSDCDVLVVLNLDIDFRSEPPFWEMTNAIFHGSFSLVGTSLSNNQGLEVAGRLPPFSSEMLFWRFRLMERGVFRSHESFVNVEKWRGAVHGACFAIRTADFLEVGGIDEKLFLYAEEFDLQTKMSRFSKNVGFVSSNSIVHHSEGSVNRHNSVINAYNLRYLAIRERKIILIVYFNLFLIKMLFQIKSKKRKPWKIIFRTDLDRRTILQQL